MRTRPRGIQDQIVHDLGMRVVRGEIPVGNSLPTQGDLSRQLGVSRTVIREATRVLVSKGLLESRQRIGTIVQPRSRWSLLDPDVVDWLTEAGLDEETLQNAMEIRQMIEPGAAGLAAQRAGPEELTRLQASFDGMANATTVDEFLEADLEYHSAIVEASHNELLIQMVKAFRAALRAELHRTTATNFEIASAISLGPHQAVLDAIKAGDTAAAYELMSELVRLAREQLEAITDLGAKETNARAHSSSAAS